jgi:nitrate reductase molybdenum cofactor assembly chaperone NarJ/NarW
MAIPAFGILAGAFTYPAPGRLAALRSAAAELPGGAVKESFSAFLRDIEKLSLGAWEELHTRTFDLDPPAAPYVGYQMWGDNYKRGAFMASMNRALAEAGVDREGELPDHLGACLRYLAIAPEPLPELVEVFGPAVDRMLKTLRDAQPDSPYIRLFQAVRAAWQGQPAGPQQKEVA